METFENYTQHLSILILKVIRTLHYILKLEILFIIYLILKNHIDFQIIILFVKIEKI